MIPFHFLVIKNKAEMNMTEQISVDYDVKFLGHVSRNCITRLCGRLILSSLGILHIDFYSIRTSLQLYQQGLRSSLFSSLHSEYMCIVLLISDLVTGVRMSLKVALLCTSLTAREVDHFLRYVLGL